MFVLESLSICVYHPECVRSFVHFSWNLKQHNSSLWWQNSIISLPYVHVCILLIYYVVVIMPVNDNYILFLICCMIFITCNNFDCLLLKTKVFQMRKINAMSGLLNQSKLYHRDFLGHKSSFVFSLWIYHFNFSISLKNFVSANISRKDTKSTWLLSFFMI